MAKIRYAASIMAFKDLKASGVFEATHKLYIFNVGEVTDESRVFNAVMEKAKTEFFTEDDGFFHWDIALTKLG